VKRVILVLVNLDDLLTLCDAGGEFPNWVESHDPSMTFRHGRMQAARRGSPRRTPSACLCAAWWKKPTLVSDYCYEGGVRPVGHERGLGAREAMVLSRDAATLVLERTSRIWDAGADGREAASGEVDPALLVAAQHGDHEAFISVLRHYERRLRVIAFHHLQDRQLMEDVLQEVAVRAYRALPAFRRESSVGTWLCRLAYNTCVDVHRRRRPDEPVAPESLALVAGADSDPADAIAERDLVVQALAGLTPEQRLALLLIDREGFDYGSAADILGVPAGTLASRLNRARAQMRMALASAVDEGAGS